MTRKRFRGVLDHTVHLREGAPFQVEMVLSKGQHLIYDLATRVLQDKQGNSVTLKPKKQLWVEEIACYLARSAVLEAQEKMRESAGNGTKPLQFGARPDPNMIWWG